MSIKDFLETTTLYNFNQVERDRWVAREAAKLPPGARVLDVGAGSCPYRPLFAHADYKAQDFKQLEDADLRFKKGYGQIDYVCDATNIPVPDGTFDAVLCTEMIEHVPDPLAVLRELARILRPGGKLLLTAPLGSGIHQAPYHFYGGYTPFWYRKFLKELGFTDIGIEANGGFFKHYSQESLRFSLMTSPFRMNGSIARRIAITPLWLLMLPWLGVVMPLICHAIDRLDSAKEFTVGYHVSAIRDGAPR